jgi:ubiquinone/menaquinone biosynthesis C-methylase UbiE
MNETTQKWFNKWSNEYDQTLGNQKRHLQMLDLAVEMSKVKAGEHVLDIGCGTGILSLKFLEAANCTVHGIDLAEDMLGIFEDKIKKLNLTNRVTIKQGDAVNLEFEDSTFDIVASTVTLHHIKDKQQIINKIYRILKPKGRFVIGDLNIDTSGDLKDVGRLRHIMDFVKDEVSAALEDGGVYAFSRMYDNGKKHILNDGEYCISFKMWSELCEKAGFKHINITPVGSSNWRKVLCAEKLAPL